MRGIEGALAGLIPTLVQESITAFCSLLFCPKRSPAALTVPSAADWKSDFGLSLFVSVSYQILPVFSQALPPMDVAAR